MIQILNPDFFEEEPNMFLGDYDAYFKIVKKRSIFFFYLSRVILYLIIFFMIMQFVDRDDQERAQVDRGVYQKSQFSFFVLI